MAKGRKSEDEIARKLEGLKRREESLSQREKLFNKLERKLKDLHVSHCPRCGYELQTVLAESLEVETCEACKGFWIGRSELEVLIKYTVDRRKNFLTQVFGPA
ncbi:MAG: TFIIB-type zinc ribbon-containing protein [Planctomycetota bacterium]|jgi:predicted Zn-ribbon and HTH transcriptional regulator